MTASKSQKEAHTMSDSNKTQQTQALAREMGKLRLNRETLRALAGREHPTAISHNTFTIHTCGLRCE